MASQANPVRVHFHDTVNINILPPLPPLQQNVDPRWGEPLPEPYINSSLGSPHQNASSAPDHSQRTAFHQIFLMSKPRFRGATQIFLAHFHLALGIILSFFGGQIYTWYSYIIFWGPPVLICSGSLAVAAHSIVSSKLVRACNSFQTTSILVSITGLVLSCIDSFSIYSCAINCGNFGTMGTMPLVILVNLLQIQLSGYIVYYGSHSLNYLLENSSQTHANVNLGFVLPDPPAYSEVTINGPPPPSDQPPPFPPPPPYPCSAPTSSSHVSNEWKDYSQPPLYSE